MIDSYKDFFSIWSDVFFRFFFLASNDDKNTADFFICPMQDLNPNNLA